MNLAHLHLLLNHFPTIGFAVGFGVFVTGVVYKSEDLKRASLGILVMLALLSIPAYVTGSAAQTAIAGGDGISDTRIANHQDAALLALVLIQITGLFAWLGLWQASGARRLARWTVAAILVSSIVTAAQMTKAANVGGEIRHPEIVSAENTEPAAGNSRT